MRTLSITIAEQAAKLGIDRPAVGVIVGELRALGFQLEDLPDDRIYIKSDQSPTGYMVVKPGILSGLALAAFHEQVAVWALAT